MSFFSHFFRGQTGATTAPTPHSTNTAAHRTEGFKTGGKLGYRGTRNFQRKAYSSAKRTLTFLRRNAHLFAKYAPLARHHINTLRTKGQPKHKTFFSLAALAYIASALYKQHKDNNTSA